MCNIEGFVKSVGPVISLCKHAPKDLKYQLGGYFLNKESEELSQKQYLVASHAFMF